MRKTLKSKNKYLKTLIITYTTAAAFILSLNENCRMENTTHRWISSSCPAMQTSQRREGRESWNCAQKFWLVALVSPSSQTGSSQTAQRSMEESISMPDCQVTEYSCAEQGEWHQEGQVEHREVQGVLTLSWQVTAACHPQERPSSWSSVFSSGYKELKGQELAFGAGPCMEPSISPIACLVPFQAIHSHLPVAAPSSTVIWLWVWSETLKSWQIPHASGFQRGHPCRSGIHTGIWPPPLGHKCFALKIVSSTFRAGENRDSTSELSSEHCLPLRISSNVSFHE